jgi:hypothetical protein
MKAAGQVIQPANVSNLRETGRSPEATPPAGMADERTDSFDSCSA